jgi:hypothetical protein
MTIALMLPCRTYETDGVAAKVAAKGTVIVGDINREPHGVLIATSVE